MKLDDLVEREQIIKIESKYYLHTVIETFESKRVKYNRDLEFLLISIFKLY